MRTCIQKAVWYWFEPPYLWKFEKGHLVQTPRQPMRRQVLWHCYLDGKWVPMVPEFTPVNYKELLGKL